MVEWYEEDIAKFVFECPNCQQMKVEHQWLVGLAQAIEIPTWKWEDVNIDFVVGLPQTQKKFDSIRVIIDRMTKLAHFLSVKTTFKAEDYVKLYIHELLRLDSVPRCILSDHDTQFMSYFSRSFQRGLYTKVKLCIAFHPQSDGQAKRIIQTLEDILWAFVLDIKGN
ncbi:MAG: hypothetical protein Q8850_02635 [Candidatus Phytoplasma australasiaticum]|nr:hypothetical protein [Candidatus Phytoplasma australasiaticum]